MRFPITSAILFASLSSVATAQFGFFDQMFGNHQGQQQQPQPHASSQWTTQAEAVPCSLYLCPDSLVCVSQPSECPCPREVDIKCIIPDAEDTKAGTVVCLVERFANAYSK
ncbi:hypothetical protein EV363DRAFT_1314105 [Boletus edulis]|nr:hypothetical protein EV363DRAFT_1314105 [Boletus edulis]